MKNFLMQGLKKSFVCLLTFSFIFSSFSSQSYAGYGIAIDIEDKNLASPAVRVLFLNIDEQKVEEVNYYCPAGCKDAHTYKIPENTQHKENPVLELIFNNEILQEVVVKSDFMTDKYTVISKFPLRKSGDANRLPFTSNGDKYYKTIAVPRDLNALTTKKTPQKAEKTAKKTKKTPEPAVVKSPTHKPTFRYFEPKIEAELKTVVIRTEDLLEKALGGDKGNAKNYTTHKEKLGEYATLLTLLEYGYTKIYDTKLPGRKGMDFMVSSGEDPSKDIFLLVESKWTAGDDAASVFLEQSLNNSIIISRLQKLSEANTAGSISAMNLIRNFFTTGESKMGKLFYRILDKNKPGRARGIGNSAYKAITEQEKIEIGTKAGIIVPTEVLPGWDFRVPDTDLAPFINSLIQNKIDVTPLFEFLKNQYATQYKEYVDTWIQMPLMTSSMAVDVKDTSNSSLPSEDDFISSEDFTTSFGKKSLSFGSASVEPSDNRKPTGKKKKTMGTSKEDPS